jgi:hypothetical protein
MPCILPVNLVRQKYKIELILQDDLLRVDEETILTSVLKWASNKCSKKGKEVNAENQRAELGNLLYLIRRCFASFTIIKFKQFNFFLI